MRTVRQQERCAMNQKKQIWSTIGLFFAFTTTFLTLVLGQSADSSQLPAGGGDGHSKDFKLTGPMGTIQLTRRPVKTPKAIRALLPRGAKVRLLQKLALQQQDTLVVYDVLDSASSNPIMDISYPAVRVIRGNQVAGRISLKRQTDDDPDWVFLEAGEIRLSSDLAGIALAFRSLGDGSASLFWVIAPQK